MTATDISTENGRTHTALAQALPRRTITAWSTPRGEWQTRDLESLRDQLRTLRATQDPIEHSRTAGQAHLRFGDGTRRAELAFMDAGGLGEPMLLTHHALRQLGREVLPGRGLDFLLDQIDLGEHGRKLSDMSWATFARTKIDPRLWRTVRIADPVTGRTQRALRSLHSTGYAAYDNLEMVEDLLAGGYSSMPLISVSQTDETLRLRFALTPGGEGPLTKANPIPMVEAWNSEVGLRSVQVKPGMFRLVCTNGLTRFEHEGPQFRWVHTGDRARIQTGVKDALTEVRVKASGVVAAYETALNVGIDDAYAWFERMTRGEDTTAGVAEQVQTALHHETTTPGSKLASVVDAVTLIAQDARDEFEQERLEQLAASLLRRGLAESLHHGGRILAHA